MSVSQSAAVVTASEAATTEATAPAVRTRLPAPPKHIIVGQRVSTIINSIRYYGYVLSEVGNKKYRLILDNPPSPEMPHHDVTSNRIRVERKSASLPPDERRHSQQNDVPVEAADNVEDERSVSSSSSSSNSDGEHDDRLTREETDMNYMQRLFMAREKIAGLVGTRTTLKDSPFTWTVVKEYHWESDSKCKRHTVSPGILKHEILNTDKSVVFATLFLHLMFADWKGSLRKLNQAIEKYNFENPDASVVTFDDDEFITGFAILIAAASHSEHGCNLWIVGRRQKHDEYRSMIKETEFDQYMKHYRFKQFKSFITSIYEDKSLEATDDWWRFQPAVTEFNKIRTEPLTENTITSKTPAGYVDVNGILHRPIPFESTNSKERKGIKPRRCNFCCEPGVRNTGGWARHFCSECNRTYCLPTSRNNQRDCFLSHVKEIRRCSKRPRSDRSEVEL